HLIPLVSFFVPIHLRPPSPTLFPYTTLFRSPLTAGSRRWWNAISASRTRSRRSSGPITASTTLSRRRSSGTAASTGSTSTRAVRSEEHTSELQSRVDLVCRLLLEKKKIKQRRNSIIYTKTKQANRNSEEK